MAKSVDFLATCPLFAKLADEERAACHELMTERVCQKDSKIIVANTIATEFFLIKSGACDVTQDGGGFLETLVPGNYFGGAHLGGARIRRLHFSPSLFPNSLQRLR